MLHYVIFVVIAVLIGRGDATLCTPSGSSLCSFGSYCSSAGACTNFAIAPPQGTANTACNHNNAITLPTSALGSYFYLEDPQCTQVGPLSATTSCVDGQHPSPTPVINTVTYDFCAQCDVDDLCPAGYYCDTSLTSSGVGGICQAAASTSCSVGACSSSPPSTAIGAYGCFNNKCYQYNALDSTPGCLGVTTAYDGSGIAHGPVTFHIGQIPFTITGYYCDAPGLAGDPQLVGLRGQSFQVHGIDGAIYNIVSHPKHQLNAEFGFLSNGTCPSIQIAGPSQAHYNCWSHPGSYMTAMSIQQWVDDRLVQVELHPGDAFAGFAKLIVNGTALRVSESTTFSGVNGTVLRVIYEHSHLVKVMTPLFDYEYDNSDHFINQRMIPKLPLHLLKTHGLLGQTWELRKDGQEISHIEGAVDDYTVVDGLFGSDFVFNLFQSDH